MRKSKAETAKTREHILEVAADQFMAHGINDAGLARVMKAAGRRTAASTGISRQKTNSSRKRAEKPSARSLPTLIPRGI